MRYVIQVCSEEEKSFGLLLQIDENATFLELHNLIVSACKYDTTQMASFFILDEKGQRLQEISLLELSTEEQEINEAVMDVSTLGEFIGTSVKTIEYQYDFFGDRYFTLNIKEIQKGEQEEPFLLQKKGEAPQQILLEGFEGLDLYCNKGSEKNIYEDYLSSFEDESIEDIDYRSLEDFEDEDFYG